MDALAQLALMTKAKLVFESADTFLSFPALTPLSYTPEQLNFGQLTSNPQMLLFSEFCQMTNMLPQGVLFQPAQGTFFWDVYYNLLKSAQVATSTLSAQQQAALQQAQAFLVVQTPDGLQVDSAAVVSYKQYKDAWVRATQNYKLQEINAENSTDPNVQAQWQNVQEPQLRALVQAAEDDWTTKGFKAQVEQAQQVELECAAQSPQLAWQNWSSQFNPDIDYLTDPNNQTFAITAFSPSDVLEQANWPTFTIDSSEIPQLVKQAPQELVTLFGTDQEDTTIDSLSFEFCSAVLDRPWFQPEALNAHFWRFSDSAQQLSDGMVPPQGQWPAYISAIVFARNIIVSTHTTGSVTPPNPIHVFPPIILRPGFPVSHPITLPIILHPIPIKTLPISHEREFPMETQPIMRVEPSAVMHIESPTIMQMESQVNMHAEPTTTPVASSVISPEIRSAVLARLNTATFPILPGSLAVGTTPTAPSTGTTGSQPPVTSDTSVSILAFICKRIPRCPDPDPTLNWGT